MSTSVATACGRVAGSYGEEVAAGITSNDVENFLFWYGPLILSVLALVTSVLCLPDSPRINRMLIVVGAVAVVCSVGWIAFLHAWDAAPDY